MAFDPADPTDHLETLHRYAPSVTRNPDLAADTVQDTVVRTLERRDRYRDDAPLVNWLIRIAHNLIVDRARRSSRQPMGLQRHHRLTDPTRVTGPQRPITQPQDIEQVT